MKNVAFFFMVAANFLVVGNISAGLEPSDIDGIYALNYSKGMDSKICSEYRGEGAYQGKIVLKKIGTKFYWVDIEISEREKYSRLCGLSGTVQIKDKIILITSKDLVPSISDLGIGGGSFEIYLDFSKPGKIYLQPQHFNFPKDEDFQNMCMEAGVYERVDGRAELKKTENDFKISKEKKIADQTRAEMALVPADTSKILNGSDLFAI
jgi:hypothetical protein